MQRKKIKIINKLGIHARAASKLVGIASRYQSNVSIRYKGREVDAKNIIDVMILAASYGSEIEVTTTGEDEKQALQAIEQLIHHRFGEEE